MEPDASNSMRAGRSQVGSDGAITISARVVAQIFFALALALSLASYAMHLITRAAEVDTIAALDVGDEVSLATWFQTLVFILAAVVLVVGGSRATQRREPRRGWWFLAWVMVLLSIDEAVSIHERLGSALREVLDTSGILYYIWVIPAVLFAAVVALVQLGWLRSLPVSTRRLVVLAGVIFVLGAAGFELLASTGDEANGTETLTSVTFSAVEELMEMIGLSLFVVVLIDHLGGQRVSVLLHSYRPRSES